MVKFKLRGYSFSFLLFLPKGIFLMIAWRLSGLFNSVTVFESLVTLYNDILGSSFLLLKLSSCCDGAFFILVALVSEVS